MTRRAATLLIAALVGSCSLPTFNPPKLEARAPGDPASGLVLLEQARHQV